MVILMSLGSKSIYNADLVEFLVYNLFSNNFLCFSNNKSLGTICHMNLSNIQTVKSIAFFYPLDKISSTDIISSYLSFSDLHL